MRLIVVILLASLFLFSATFSNETYSYEQEIDNSYSFTKPVDNDYMFSPGVDVNYAEYMGGEEMTKEDKKLEKHLRHYSSKNYMEIDVEVTAYTAGYESTGKTPDHPLYGVMASGQKVRHGAVAGPEEFPFGTKVYIPNYGKGEVLDRGGAIKWDSERQTFIFDVYIENLEEARRWGRRELTITVYTNEMDEKDIERVKSKIRVGLND